MNNNRNQKQRRVEPYRNGHLLTWSIQECGPFAFHRGVALPRDVTRDCILPFLTWPERVRLGHVCRAFVAMLRTKPFTYDEIQDMARFRNSPLYPRWSKRDSIVRSHHAKRHMLVHTQQRIKQQQQYVNPRLKSKHDLIVKPFVCRRKI
jgi:hypothetical protein